MIELRLFFALKNTKNVFKILQASLLISDTCCDRFEPVAFAYKYAFVYPYVIKHKFMYSAACG